MSRRGTAEKKTIKSDPIYRNRLVNMLVNRILKHGKKSLAYQILYRAMKRVQQKEKRHPLSVLRQAIRQITLHIGVKTRRRKRGSTRQVPVEIGYTQGKVLAIRWLLKAARKRPGRRLSNEVPNYRMLSKGRALPYTKRKRLVEWQRQIELLHIFVNP